jgi:hypothetical protein
MADLTPQQVHQIWLQAAERVKDRVIAPTLYRAVELGHGITIEDGLFVLGFSGADMPMAGHLRSSQHLAIVEQSISEIVGTRLRLKIIEGTTMEDYLAQKRLQQSRDTAQVFVDEQRAKDRAVSQEWETVTEQITRAYAKMQQRQFAQIRGKFLMWAFETINDAVNKFNYTDESDDVHKRALARLFEKLATIMEVSSTMLAYEFLRLREDGKLSKK